jgi:hypothetical protein
MELNVPEATKKLKTPRRIKPTNYKPNLYFRKGIKDLFAFYSGIKL